jgi:hypothetical protein
MEDGELAIRRRMDVELQGVRPRGEGRLYRGDGVGNDKSRNALPNRSDLHRLSLEARRVDVQADRG